MNEWLNEWLPEPTGWLTGWLAECLAGTVKWLTDCLNNKLNDCLCMAVLWRADDQFSLNIHVVLWRLYYHSEMAAEASHCLKLVPWPCLQWFDVHLNLLRNFLVDLFRTLPLRSFTRGLTDHSTIWLKNCRMPGERQTIAPLEARNPNRKQACYLDNRWRTESWSPSEENVHCWFSKTLSNWLQNKQLELWREGCLSLPSLHSLEGKDQRTSIIKT